MNFGSKVLDGEWMLECSKTSGTDEFVRMHPAGYDMPLGERGAGLSGGQRQSVGIARALINNSDIWMFDEPTNAMDQTSESIVLNNLKSCFYWKNWKWKINYCKTYFKTI